MGKKSQGKQKKDRYYYLAKDVGFRSRSAFKLIQLNRKFDFLQGSKVLVDLCAAPGGWMQVAKKNMPLASIIVGVDLYPIKPIPGCVGLVGDIRTDGCLRDICRELQTTKADVVLCDGSPSIGQAWETDAFKQSSLILVAMKIAVTVLKKGGWFITKLFRSKNYHSLLWVFKQLFQKVHASKPQASRNESAEIYIVCKNYLAPTKIDKRFFEDKHVFEELSLAPVKPLSVTNIFPKKAQPVGYNQEVGVYGVYNKISATQFIKSNGSLEILKTANEFEIDDQKILDHHATTDEIKLLCSDIKILNTKDLKNIISWAVTLNTDIFSDPKPKKKKVTTEEELEYHSDEDDEVLKDLKKEITTIEAKEVRLAKIKKRKLLKAKNKLKTKIDMKMIVKGDLGPEEDTKTQEDLFNATQVKNMEDYKMFLNQPPDILAHEKAPEELKSNYVVIDKDDYELDDSGNYKAVNQKNEDETDISEVDSIYTDNDSNDGLEFDEVETPKLAKKRKKVSFAEENVESEDDEDVKIEKNPVLTNLDVDSHQTRKIGKAEMWFEKEIFQNLVVDDDEQYEFETLAESVVKKGGQLIGKHKPLGQQEERRKSVKETDEEDEDEKEGEGEDDENETAKPELFEENDMEMSEEEKENVMSDSDDKKKEKHEPRVKLTPTELALGAIMVSSRKAKRDLIDKSWHKFSFNDTNLPVWFELNESKHMKNNIKIKQKLLTEYNEKYDEINVRTPKKVFEAKARKKKRELKVLDKRKRKLANILEKDEISLKEKEKLLRKIHARKKENITYVVAKKKNAAKRMRRPLNIKGRYRVVDPRMKKDKRAKHAKEAKVGKRKIKGKGRTSGMVGRDKRK